MRTQLGLFAIMILPAAGCATLSSGTHAHADIQARSGSSVVGHVAFVEKKGVVKAHIVLTGFAPGSEHGFHVHDKGDCSAPDAASAGGHFNPTNAAHGQSGHGAHHLGDLPSLVADSHGAVNADLVLPDVTLADGPNSIIGRSVIIHRDRDDYVTQPSGNSGARIGCGVIARN